MAKIEASVEGPIQAVDIDNGGTGVVVSAMGIRIRFLPGITASGRTKTIKTPTNTLSPLQFRSTKKFPGRAEAGFVGGTIIAEGTYDTDARVLDAEFIIVEPAETVILGALTENSPGTPRKLKVNGVSIEMLTDDRLSSHSTNPAVPIFLNQYGFPMKIETATTSPTGPTPNPPPAPTSIEGYFAGGAFHTFLFEYGGTGELFTDPTTIPQISMIRAAYRDREAQFEIEARGFVTTSHVPPGSPPQSIEVFRMDRDPATGQLVETALDRADMDPREPGFERWRFTIRRNKAGGLLAGIPVAIRVKNQSGIVPASGAIPAHPAFAELEPDVREP